MTNKQICREGIAEAGLIAVVRARRTEHLPAALQILVDAGVRVLELTATIPEVPEVLAGAIGQFSREAVLIGAGTVTDADTARAVIEAGARFVVSPIHDPTTAEICRQRDVLYVPGAYTPQEVFTAWKEGGDLIKLFPAAVGGTALLESLQEPFPQIEFITTDGTAETAASFLRAGSRAVCFGGAALARLIEAADFAGIEKMARALVGAVAAVGGRSQA